MLLLENKLLVYQAMLKPFWTYVLQLWGSASNPNIDILEKFQSKVLRIIADAPWCVANVAIKSDLEMLSIRQEVRDYSVTYRQTPVDHPNRLEKFLFQKTNYSHRLERYYLADLATGF